MWRIVFSTELSFGFISHKKLNYDNNSNIRYVSMNQIRKQKLKRHDIVRIILQDSVYS